MRGSVGLVMLLALAVALPCAAMPYTLSPDEDAVVRQMDPTLNYGAAGALAVGGTAATNSDGVVQGRMDSFMRFSTAAFVAAMDAQFGAGAWVVESAVLTLNEQRKPNNPMYSQGAGQFSILWLSQDSADNWVEGTGKPNSPKTNGISFSDEVAMLSASDLGLGTFSSNGPVGTPDFVDVVCDLALPSAFVGDLTAGGYVTLFLAPADDTIGFQFGARENLTESSRPYLVLTAEAAPVIPEPGTAALVVLGILAGLRRRRARA